MKKLDSQQRKRLVELVNERLRNSNVRDIAKLVECSFGYISEIASGSKEKIPVGNALSICMGLGISPYYVLEGELPKYMDWRETLHKNLVMEEDW